MRLSAALVAVLGLTGCPWIAGPPPGDADTDDEVGVECVDFDFDGACDNVDECVDGIDDTTDQYVLAPGESVSGLACGDDESIRVSVDAGCTYSVSVDADSTVGVEIIEDSYILASGQAPLSLEAVSASFDTWEVLLFGDDDVYTVSTAFDCPSCGMDRINANWGDVVAARLCPWSPELTVVMSRVRPECEYGVNLVTSDQAMTTLVVVDGASETSITDDSGYLGVVGPVSANTTEIRVVISQPSGAQVEQGVLLDLAEYCD